MMNIYPTPMGGETLNHPLKILVMEDNLVQQKLTLRLLERLNYKADKLDHGSDLLEALINKKYDVLLLDFILIELGTLNWIKQNNQERFIEPLPQIIVMTSDSLQKGHKCLQNFPVHCFLEKPLKLEEIGAILSQCNQLVPTNPSPEVLDQNALDRLIDMVGKEACVSIIESYIEDAPNIFQRLAKGLSERDITTIYKAAHSLKSSSATVGALTLSQICKELESLGRNLAQTASEEIPYDSEISSLIEQIYTEYERVKQAFMSLFMDLTSRN